MSTPVDMKQLRQDWVQNVYDGLDMDAMCQLAWEYLEQSVGTLTDEELLEDIERVYPEWLQSYLEE